jgi:hypothetical protein
MKRRGTEFGVSALAFSSVLALAGSVQAQAAAPAAVAPAPAPAAAPATAGGDAQASAQLGGGAQAGGAMTLPGAAPAPAARAAAGDSDHDQVIGTLAVGYLGRRSMFVGSTGAGGGGVPLEVSSPVIGVRYWIDEMIGIDAGIGMGINSASLNVAGQDQPAPGSTAFIIHGGVPLALASAGHFSFQVIPELNLGLASWSLDRPAGAPGWSGSGFHFDIGARAGAEIHFGFIGLPKLSLQGTVGLALAMDNTKLEDKAPAPQGNTTKASTLALGTSVQDNPWNIFTSNVAALYYF